MVQEKIDIRFMRHPIPLILMGFKYHTDPADAVSIPGAALNLHLHHVQARKKGC